MKTINLLKNLIPYLIQWKKFLIMDIICAICATCFNVISPMLIRQITNNAVMINGGFIIKDILDSLIIYIILSIISATANYCMNYYGNLMSTHVEAEMRQSLFDHLQTLPYSYYCEHKIGSIMSCITNDLMNIASFIHNGTKGFMIPIVTISISLYYLLSINVIFTITVAITLPILFWLYKKFNNYLSNIMKNQNKQIGEINSQVEDSLMGIKIVKSFTNEKLEMDKFKRQNNKYVAIKEKAHLMISKFYLTIDMSGNGLYILVVIVGALMIGRKINVGDYTAYLLYIGMLWSSIHSLVSFSHQLRRSVVGIERFCQIMSLVGENIGHGINKDLNGNIQFKNVSFKYNEWGNDILCNINLYIKKGEHVAIVGESGIGKTTMINLLLKFFYPTSGDILINNTSVNLIDVQHIRKNIGIVSQECYLFNGTIYENILYGNTEATRNDVIKAAKKADIHNFIMSLENGYDTNIGPNGIKLSGGQRQKISIARVLLKNPLILILDEATSALDNESEKKIKESISQQFKNKTVITIAHRLSSIMDADRIVVLSDKSIAEEGTHISLINKKGVYYKLYSSMK